MAKASPDCPDARQSRFTASKLNAAEDEAYHLYTQLLYLIGSEELDSFIKLRPVFVFSLFVKLQ
jgi:hypothetical protein